MAHATVVSHQYGMLTLSVYGMPSALPTVSSLVTEETAHSGQRVFAPSCLLEVMCFFFGCVFALRFHWVASPASTTVRIAPRLIIL